jgi:effector-binding domain-containing protein
MKIKFLLPLFITASAAGGYFYPVKETTSIIIHTSFIKVYNQLNVGENWKNWNRSLKMSEFSDIKKYKNNEGFDISTNRKTTEVKYFGPFVFQVSSAGDKYQITLTPQKYDHSTVVTLSYKSNVLYRLFPGESEKRWRKTSLMELKNYLEDPLSFYGVGFKKTTLRKMSMMVYDTVVNNKDRIKEMKALVKKIRSNIPVDQMAEKDKVYVRVVPCNKNFNILMGVHVTRKLPGQKKLTYLEIPDVTAFIVNYAGRYSDIQNVYRYMESYLAVHGMKEVMGPVEEYSGNSLPSNDKDYVETEIIFPAY